MTSLRKLSHIGTIRLLEAIDKMWKNKITFEMLRDIKRIEIKAIMKEMYLVEIRGK